MNEDMLDLKSEAELEDEAAKAEKAATGEPDKEKPKTAVPQEGDVLEKEPDKDAGTDKPENDKAEKADDSPYGKPGHTPAGVQERINSLTRRNHDLKSEIELLKTEIERLKKHDDKDVEPTREDFLKAGKTEDDYIDWRVQKKLDEAVNRRLDARERENSARQRTENYRRLEDEARRVFPDYDSVVYTEDLPGSVKVGEKVVSLPNGPDVMYTINKQPKLRERYVSLDEAGRISMVSELSEHLAKMKEEALAKIHGVPEQETAQTQQRKENSEAAPEVEQKKNNLREPSVGNGGKPVQPPDLANCSMEEFERYYGNMR